MNNKIITVKQMKKLNSTLYEIVTARKRGSLRLGIREPLRREVTFVSGAETEPSASRGAARRKGAGGEQLESKETLGRVM